MKKVRFIPGVVFALALFAGCDTTEAPTPAAALNAQSNTLQAKKTPAIWADCEIFATNGTNTSFKPGHGNFDNLYTGTTFADGIGSISESKPGDTDYNGGRWHVYTLKAGVTTDYSSACSVEDLDLNDFEPTDTYFECPLRPMRGNSGN